jgi:hypothetical protein
MKQHNRFRMDNTEGYTAKELALLNMAFDIVVDAARRHHSDEEDDKSWLDDIADGVLANFG